MKKRLISIFLICCLLCTMLPTMAFATEQTGGSQTSAPASIQSVSYTQTNIEADAVGNYGGYGSLRINETYEDDGWSLKSFPKTALIDSTGSYLFPYKETWLRYRYDDNVVSLTTDSAYNGYWLEGQESDMPGYYSINGDALFTNEYVYASPMMDGYAFVMSGNSWSGLDAYLIDRTGTIVYSFPEGFGKSLSAGGGNWSDGFNTENECGWPSEGLIAYGTVLDPCDWNYRHDGYRNMAGEVVFTNTGYNNAYPFYEGLAGVKSAATGLYGFINTSGDEVISCQYEGFSGFCDGYAAAKMDGKWGYINKYGTTVIPFEYDAAYGAGSGLFAVVKDGKCGMVNVENEVVVPLEYDDISSFESGVAYAIKDGEVVIVKPAVSSESDFLFDAETGTITEYKGLGGAVVIPASIGGVSVKSIGGGAFSRCESLVNVTIANGVTSVGDFAFLGCNNLKTAILPEGITRIGEQAFDACGKLVGITIPSTVTSIGKRAFFNCNSLSELTIEEGATSLGEYATFWGCHSLTSVTIPASVASVGVRVFDNCGNLSRITVDSANTVYCNDENGIMFSKDHKELVQYPAGSKRSSYIVPDGVTSISGGAFGGCKNLTSLTIPASVSCVGAYGITQCDKLTSLTFKGNAPSEFGEGFWVDTDGFAIHAPKNDTTWTTGSAYDAMAQTWNDYPIVFDVEPQAATIIDSGFCGGDTSAKLIEDRSQWSGYDYDNIYDNLTWTLDSEGTLTISGTGVMADFTIQTAPWFDKYSLIKSTVIGNGVTNVGNAAFCYCTIMESVTIPASVTSIGDWAFEGCQKLTSVTIPSGVTSIGAYAFNGCEKLESLTIPANVTEIGQASFGHSGIKAFSVADGNNYFKSVDGVLFSADLTKLICYPPAAELEEYVVPDSVTSIGYLAVQAKALRKITVPKTVTFLDKGAIEPIFEFVGSEEVSYCPTVYCYENSAAYNFTVNNNLPYSVIEESEILVSGYCGGEGNGTNLTWTLDEHGVLIISGTGKMADFNWNSDLQCYDRPWTAVEDQIVNVVIKDGVTSVGERAFEGLSNLFRIEIAESVTTLGEYAIYNCDYLGRIYFYGNAPIMGSKSISYNNNLVLNCRSDKIGWTNIPAYDSVEGTWNNHKISIWNIVDEITVAYEIDISSAPALVQRFGTDKISYLMTLTDVGEKVTVGNGAFSDGLGFVIFPESTVTVYEDIDNDVFMEGFTLQSDQHFGEAGALQASVPYNLFATTEKLLGAELTPETNICINLGVGTYFADWISFEIEPNQSIYTYALDKPEPQIIAFGFCGGDTNADYDEVSGCYKNLEWTLNENGVLTVSGTGAMLNYNYIEAPWEEIKSEIRSVVIENGVTGIGFQAFRECSSLTSVAIGNSVTSIGNEAFDWCASLTSVTIPDSVTSIGDYSFAECDSLASVTIPDSVTSIGYSAFRRCISLTSVTIPDSVTSIGDEAFCSCFSLTSITVDVNNSAYSSDSDGVLFNKEKTNLIQYPIGNSRTAYTIPDSVTSIDDYAFHDCDSLTSVTIPDSVTSIAGYAFSHCHSLTSVAVPDSVTGIGENAFCYCNSLTSVTIPNSVTSIGGYAFGWCNSLTSVTIPNSVTSIGGYAFGWCNSLTSVTIPKCVTSIGDCAFSLCSHLAIATFEGNASTQFGDGIFDECADDFTIHAPKNNTTWTAAPAYDAQAQTWNGYPIVFDVENTCEHAWNDGVVTTQPTHLAEGVKTFTCTKCGATKTESVAKLTEHTYDQQIADAKYLKSAATCNDAAVYYKSCLCGAVGTETFTYGDPAGHTYGTPSYEWDGTSCTASRACTKCSAETGGHSQTETVTGHYVKDTDATCTVCEKGHYEASFTNQAFAAQSTAKDSVDQGAPLGHSFPETWEKHNETQHKHTCTRCHTEVEYENHAWNDGVITTPATAAAEGVKTLTCTKCGETKTEPVAKLAEQNIWKSPDITWTYGEKTQITVNFTNLSENGGTLSYASSNENVASVTAGQTGCTVNIIGAGETTITATAAAVSGKYVETSVSVKLTINPASLTVTAENVSISYGSEASGFDYTVSGLVLGETAANVLSGTPEYQCAYRQYDNVGNYPITVSGLNAANYTISYQAGTLTVKKLADYTLSFVENTLLQSVDYRTPVLATVTPQDSTAQILVEYYVGASWTNTLPTTSGTYPVRASLIASDNLVIPQTPTYIEDSLIIRDGAFIGNKDVMIDVTENDDGSVEIGELTPEQIQAVTDDAAAKDKSVTLDLTGNGVASGAQGLTIPASLVDAMNDSSDVESFTVKAKDAEIEMDSSVLNTLAGSLEEGSKLTIQMETVSQENLSTSQKEALESIGGGSGVVVLDLKLIAKQYDEHGTETSSNEIHQLGGVASVQVAYDFEEAEGKILVALYVDENGNTTYLPVTYKDGFVSFRTDHFSVYAVTEIEKSDCGHSWDEGVVTLEPTTTSTGIRTYTCLICGETKTETIAKKPSGGNIGGGGGAASAKVQIADNISHGKISADMDSASAGQTVTLTVAPDKGFTLETLTVLDKSGKEVEVKNLGNNKYSFKMPSGNVTIKATFMEDNTMLNFFVDVKATDYFYDAVLWAAENGITKGTDAVHFSPDMDTTRAQVVTFLWRAAGCPEAEHTAAVFKDVSPDAYYVKAVEWALSEGITKGTSNTTFSPDAVCTRGQIVTFLARFAGVEDTDTASVFSDVNTTDYFAAAVKWAKDNGVTEGTSATTFSPNTDCTRAQVVTFLYRWMVK